MFQEFNFIVPFSGALTGNVRTIAAAGDWFRVRESSVAPLKVTLMPSGVSVRCLPGQGLRGKRFDYLVIENVDDTYTAFGSLLVSSGAALVDDRVTGDVAISDLITERCQYWAAPGPTAVGFNTTQIVGTAENKSGLIVRAAWIDVESAAGNTTFAMFASGPIAPSTFATENPRIYVARAAASGAGVSNNLSQPEMRRRLPPGWGLWQVTSVQTNPATSVFHSVCFELLR
ncbi:MAG TPA: hypothetical protein P5024_12265 [Burkholderiaceae bacterium]|nr:hypothetical protein [Burkholderiaceae bacterium]